MSHKQNKNLNNVGMNSDSAQNEFQSMYARSGNNQSTSQSDLQQAKQANQQMKNQVGQQNSFSSQNDLQQARQANQQMRNQVGQQNSFSSQNQQSSLTSQNSLQQARQANQQSAQNAAQSSTSQSSGQQSSVMEKINNDPQMKQYFDSLPKSTQETILQSGTEIQSYEQLKAIAENFNSSSTQG